jgi:hypothetical protein
MIKDWNADEIISSLQRIYFATTDPKMEGFTTWRCKQDLYRVQFALEDMLNKCPTYAPEQEWLAQQQLERDQTQMWSTLRTKKSR